MHRPSASLAVLAVGAATVIVGLALATWAPPSSAQSAPPAPTQVAAGSQRADPDALPALRIWWPLDSVRRDVPGAVPIQPPEAGPAPDQAPARAPEQAQAQAAPPAIASTVPPASAAGAERGDLDDDLPPPAAQRPSPDAGTGPGTGKVPETDPNPPTSVAVTAPVSEPIDPRVSVVASGAAGAGAKQPRSGGLSGSELSFGLSPELALPRVQTTLPASGLEPPSPEVGRWLFAAPEGGLTWESQESTKEGEWIILRGQVDIRAGVERIQADEVRLNQTTMQLRAEGNVILDRLDSRMAGKSLEYDVHTNTGVMHEAFGTTGEDLSFTADIAEKVGDSKYLLRGATFTSCTQPGPLWQVRATKAIIAVDKFVYMWNPRVVFGKVPAFYLPWVAIPIRDERSTGFMIPKIGNSTTRGFTVSDEFFWAINRQVDLTLGATWWDKFGYRADAEARWFLDGMPEYGFLKGAFVHANDDYIQDPANGVQDLEKAQNRYDIVWEHRQSFGEWDFTATGEVGSDQFVNYDLPGDEGVGDLSPIFNQKFTVQRTWGRHSLNITAENNDSELEVKPPTWPTEPPDLPPYGNDPNGDLTLGRRTEIDRQLPAVEYRTSGLQLGGKKWASLSMEASVGRIQQIEQLAYTWDYDAPTYSDVTLEFDDTTLEHSYQRADFYPQFRFPLGTAWLQVVPEVNLRASYWSRREFDPRTRTEPYELEEPASQPPPAAPVTIPITYVDGEDEGVLMWGWDAGLTLEGPDFSRIFNTDALPGQRKWQHLIEPSIEFNYAPESDTEPIIAGDRYASYWSQRFAKVDAAGVVTRGGTQSSARARLVNTLRTKVVAQPGDREEQARDWLIWTLSTNYDFEVAANTGTFDGRTETNWWGDISSDMNFKPSEETHLSLRNTYDVLQDDVISTSLVGGVGGNWGYVDLSVSSTRDSTTLKAQPGDAGVTGEHWFYKGDRIRIGYDLAYKFDEEKPPVTVPPTEPPTPWLYKRFVVSYYNQCIGFSLSWEDQALRGLIEREQEWIFTVSLKDLGNYLRYKKSRKP